MCNLIECLQDLRKPGASSCHIHGTELKKPPSKSISRKWACIPHWLEGISFMRGQKFLGICENLFEHLISLVKVWSFSSFTELCKMALNAMNCHGTVILWFSDTIWRRIMWVFFYLVFLIPSPFYLYPHLTCKYFELKYVYHLHKKLSKHYTIWTDFGCIWVQII